MTFSKKDMKRARERAAQRYGSERKEVYRNLGETLQSKLDAQKKKQQKSLEMMRRFK